jgi:mono/diheme cytochrome c family protein
MSCGISAGALTTACAAAPRAIAALVTAMLAFPLPGAYAEDAPDATLNDVQREGLRLFSQSCGVCHAMIQQRTRQYGPALSRDTLGGDEEAMRDFIGNGTPRMPGFRFNFDPAQIDAIVQYIKTIPPQSTQSK